MVGAKGVCPGPLCWGSPLPGGGVLTRARDSQISSVLDMEAVTFKKLVKGHAYSVTGAKQVPGPPHWVLPASVPDLAPRACGRGCGRGRLSYPSPFVASWGLPPGVCVLACLRCRWFASGAVQVLPGWRGDGGGAVVVPRR